MSIPSTNSITAETPSDVSATTLPAPVADPTRLIYITALGTILSLALAFSAPTWMWLWPIASIVSIATSIGLYVTTWKTEQALYLIPSKRLPFFRTVKPQDYKRYYLVLALRLSSFLFYFFGFLSVMIPWLRRSNSWDALEAPLSFGIVAALVYFVAAVLWGREGSLADRLLHRLPAQLIIGLLIAGSLFILLRNTPDWILQLKTGPAVPWTQEWAFVQESVQTKYPNAVVTMIGASREFKSVASYNAALQTRFYLARADQTEMQATLLDTNPENTLSLDPPEHTTRTEPYRQIELNAFRANYSHVLIGPRDALKIAVANQGASGPAPDNIFGPNIQLFLSGSAPARSISGTFKSLNRPAVWSVGLYSSDPYNDPTVWIDAETGQVLLVGREK